MKTPRQRPNMIALKKKGSTQQKAQQSRQDQGVILLSEWVKAGNGRQPGIVAKLIKDD